MALVPGPLTAVKRRMHLRGRLGWRVFAMFSLAAGVPLMLLTALAHGTLSQAGIDREVVALSSAAKSAGWIGCRAAARGLAGLVARGRTLAAVPNARPVEDATWRPAPPALPHRHRSSRRPPVGNAGPRGICRAAGHRQVAPDGTSELRAGLAPQAVLA